MAHGTKTGAKHWQKILLKQPVSPALILDSYEGFSLDSKSEKVNSLYAVLCCNVWIVWDNNLFNANKKCCQNKEHKYSLVVMGSCFSQNVQIKFFENYWALPNKK